MIWLALMLVFALTNKDVRRALKSLCSSIFKTHIIISFSLYFGYIALGIYIARALGIWDMSLLKDTLLWIPLIGLPLLMRFDQVSETPHFFRTEMIRVFEVSVFIEFFLGLQSFSLPIELILVPTAFVLTISAVFSETDPEFASSKKSINRLLSLLGILVMLATIWKFASAIEEQDFGELTRSLLLVIWLPLFVLPFVYLFSLYTLYELAFIRLRRRSKPSNQLWKAKLGIALSLRGSAADVGKFADPWPDRVAEAKTVREAREIADRYKAARRTGNGNIWVD